MLISYNWLNKYFDGKLPEPERVAEAFTFHAWEVDEVTKIDSDTVFDISILPDKAMWALSYRGVAKDLSVILDIPLKQDPLTEEIALASGEQTLTTVIETPNCLRFAAAKISGVKVGPSPDWLKSSLEAIGQRSINNIVDASNYVMFDLGQPSHAFDAAKVGEKGLKVRNAKDGETLTGLDEIEYTFTGEDTLITRQDNNEILSIAGLKGGINSGISESTTDIIVEVANWNALAVRKTGQRLKLRTDASTRYENGIVPEMVPFGLKAVTKLIMAVAGGEIVSSHDTSIIPSRKEVVTLTLTKLNSVLGVEMKEEEVANIIKRFGWEYTINQGEFSIEPPFERTDLSIEEDVIEEIGRIYGYEHIKAVTPEPIPLTEINLRWFYSELVRDTLVNLGFSEIYTSSFRDKDDVKLANAFASDKGYLRSSLLSNMAMTLSKNAPNADLLGLGQIRLFEFGTVFNQTGEHFMLALGVSSPSGYKAKLDEPIISEALSALSDEFGLEIKAEAKDGVLEIEFDEILAKLPTPSSYKKSTPSIEVSYRPFSTYPAITRDIAMWVDSSVTAEDIEKVLHHVAGDLRIRTTLFDEFEKDEKTSYAFRLVFQSKERTLTDTEVNETMEKVYMAIEKEGWEVR